VALLELDDHAAAAAAFERGLAALRAAPSARPAAGASDGNGAGLLASLWANHGLALLRLGGSAATLEVALASLDRAELKQRERAQPRAARARDVERPPPVGGGRVDVRARAHEPREEGVAVHAFDLDHVARQVASQMGPDQNVVTVFADGGARYASANLFTEQDEAVLEETLETRLWW
jgi:hypothetical protein